MNYTYSRLSSESVIEIINLQYQLTGIIDCKYYVFGLHDNYLIENNNKLFIFRIYRNDWRSEEEILFELELLSYLDNKKINVAAPIPSKNSKLCSSIECPEGKRITALFNYANGMAPNKDITLKECKLLGSSVATLHKETKYFKTQYTRPILNLEYLVNRSLNLIKPFITINQYKYLQVIKTRIMLNTSDLNEGNSDFGICVGDINSSNFHINEKNIITHFDFDQCGYAYRAFEIGKFISSMNSDNNKTEKVSAFIDGYEKSRKLTDLEKMTIPSFEIASIIWVMSIYVSNLNKIGYQYLEKPFWDKRIILIESLNDKMV
jgi:Ser/Thr protein kinase RdoA (MazF antagonist)